MIVLCKMSRCPYNDRGEYCARRIIAISEQGTCCQLYFNGREATGAFDARDDQYKEKISMKDGEWSIDDGIKSECGEEINSTDNSTGDRDS